MKREPINMLKVFIDELRERFCLVYSGVAARPDDEGNDGRYIGRPAHLKHSVRYALAVK